MTTCRKCKRSWSSLVECHCDLCHEHFSTVWGFDLHKPNAEIGCLDPSTIKNKHDKPLLRLATRREGQVWVAYTNYEEKPGQPEIPPPDPGTDPLTRVDAGSTVYA